MKTGVARTLLPIWAIVWCFGVSSVVGCDAKGGTGEGIDPSTSGNLGEQAGTPLESAPVVTEASADDLAGVAEVQGSGQTGVPIGGAAYYLPVTIEERVDESRIVARVQIVEIGEIRYNTPDGGRPAGVPSMDDAGWIIIRPITMTVVTAFKSDITGIATLQTLKLASPPELDAYDLHETFSYEVGKEGIVFMYDFSPEAEADPVVIYVHQLENDTPAAYQPAYAGAVYDWFGFSGGMAEGSMFDLESFAISELEERIENHLGP